MSGDDWDGVRIKGDGTRHWLDEHLLVLSHPRRRDILYPLTETEVTDLDTLSRKVAAIREEVTPDRVPPEVQKKVKIDLVHTHLPKLDDAGIIEFDQRSGAIRCRAFPPMLEQLVKTCRDIEAIQ